MSLGPDAGIAIASLGDDTTFRMIHAGQHRFPTDERGHPAYSEMTKTLITGANKGLGYQAAKRLVAEGHEVWVGARDRKLGEEAARSLDARFVQLDLDPPGTGAWAWPR